MPFDDRVAWFAVKSKARDALSLYFDCSICVCCWSCSLIYSFSRSCRLSPRDATSAASTASGRKNTAISRGPSPGRVFCPLANAGTRLLALGCGGAGFHCSTGASSGRCLLTTNEAKAIANGRSRNKAGKRDHAPFSSPSSSLCNVVRGRCPQVYYYAPPVSSCAF